MDYFRKALDTEQSGSICDLDLAQMAFGLCRGLGKQGSDHVCQILTISLPKSQRAPLSVVIGTFWLYAKEHAMQIYIAFSGLLSRNLNFEGRIAKLKTPSLQT